MRALIVGCGYIGQALGLELVRMGHAVVGLRRGPEAAEHLRALGIEPLIGDLTSPGEWMDRAGAFDWVINCVASSRGGLEEYERVYLEGTRSLLAWLAPRPPSRLVYTSSTSVYGQVDGSEVTESDPTEPGTSTGQILVRTEALLRTAAASGFPTTILRVAGIYGPDRGYWIKQFLQDVARLDGDGGRFLNMVHRDDVVGAIIAALERGQSGAVYNVVDDEPVTQLELFRWLSDRLGRPLPASAPTDATALRKRGLTSKRVLNRRLRTELGYVLRYPSFREGYQSLLSEV